MDHKELVEKARQLVFNNLSAIKHTYKPVCLQDYIDHLPDCIKYKNLEITDNKVIHHLDVNLKAPISKIKIKVFTDSLKNPTLIDIK